MSLILLYFFNPTLTSLRGIQAASQLQKVQKTLGCRPTSLRSFTSASCVFDAEVNLGGQKAEGVLTQPYRVVILERSSARSGEDTRLVLVTNRMDLDAEMIALADRYRCQIELFFRWLKCILGCKHLLSASQNGVALQVDTALIASLLITLWTGRTDLRNAVFALSRLDQPGRTDGPFEFVESPRPTRFVRPRRKAAPSKSESLHAAPISIHGAFDRRRKNFF